MALFPNGEIWIPSTQIGSDWLLVALHGSEGSSQNFLGLEKELDIDTLNYLYLNGPIPSYSNFRWYNERPEEAFNYLANVFETLKSKGFPPEKTFMLGFSQGAALTFEFGARFTPVMAGYIAISGRIENLPSLIHEGRPKGFWLVTHGTKDYNLSPAIIADQVNQLRMAGFDIDYQEFDKVHEFDSKEELPYIREWILKHF